MELNEDELLEDYDEELVSFDDRIEDIGNFIYSFSDFETKLNFSKCMETIYLKKFRNLYR